MKKAPAKTRGAKTKMLHPSYGKLLNGLVRLIEEARLAAARSINAVLTSTYWMMGQRIVEYEQAGERRAPYGDALLERLSRDLTERAGRGFSERNLRQMRLFYQGWPIRQTLSAEFRSTSSRQKSASKLPAPIRQTLSAELDTVPQFPLPWSHYVRLLSVEDPEARKYYEREALLGGWSARQLDRQVATKAYTRGRGAKSSSLNGGELTIANEAIRDPFVLEFLNLKDEYSETDLEDGLIHCLEYFLLELGNDFAFVGRQKRLRVGNEWYRLDLLLFHRGLRCLILVELKLGKFSEKDAAVAHYALGNLGNNVLAREYQLGLPDLKTIEVQMESARQVLAIAPAKRVKQPQ